MSRTPKDWAQERGRALTVRGLLRQAEEEIDELTYPEVGDAAYGLRQHLKSAEEIANRIIGTLTLDWGDDD